MGAIWSFFEWIANAVKNAYVKITIAIATLGSAASALVSVWRSVTSMLSHFAQITTETVARFADGTATASDSMLNNPFYSAFVDLFALDYLIEVSTAVFAAVIAFLQLMFTFLVVIFVVFGVLFTWRWASRTVKLVSLSSLDME